MISDGPYATLSTTMATARHFRFHKQLISRTQAGQRNLVLHE